jgi:hypothetical protein
VGDSLCEGSALARSPRGVSGLSHLGRVIDRQ